MDRELIDRAWRILPAEFKRVVKAHYAGLNAAYKAYLSKDSLTNEECDRCKAIREKIVLYNMYFGHHNLASDAEGEEMLTVSRKEIQQLVAVNDKLIKKHPGRDSIEAIQAKTVNTILNRLFGSKCLPDDTKDNTKNEAIEPRFKVGDVAVVRGFDHPLIKRDGAIVTILSYHDKGDFYSCAIAPNVGIDIGAKYLEPYTEPENENSPILQPDSVKKQPKSDEETAKSNSSCRERLQIAAMIAQGIMTNSNPQMVDMNVERVVDLAILTADTLIAESDKGDESADAK